MSTRFAVVLVLLSTFSTLSPSHALSETDQDKAIASLQSVVLALQSTVNSQAVTIKNQQSIIAFFTKKTDTTRADGRKGTELFITSCNVHVVNGLGATDGDPQNTGTPKVNGLGNVIIGYNALRGGTNLNERSGSHNIVVGDAQNFPSYGGVVFGLGNTISGPYSSVTAGYHNVASSIYASVSGGVLNTASSAFASVSGGNHNTAGGSASVVTGGYNVLQNSGNGFAAGGIYGFDTPGPGMFHSP